MAIGVARSWRRPDLGSYLDPAVDQGRRPGRRQRGPPGRRVPEHRPGARGWLIDLLPDCGSTLVELPPAGRRTVVDSVTESIFAREKKIGK